MNRFQVALIALALVAGAVSASDEQELVNEIHSDDSDVDEGLDGLGWGYNKQKEPQARPYFSPNIKEQWGDDIIQHGIPETVAGRQQSCAGAKSEANCRACCQTDNKAYSYRTDLSLKSLKKLRVSRCVCASKTPEVIPK